MKKFSAFFVLISSLVVYSFALANPWGVVANLGSGGDPGVPASISTIDLGYSPPQAYGPFLEGQLDPIDPNTLEPILGSGLLDLTFIPGTKYILVSSFGSETIYRINMSNPRNPVLEGSLVLNDGSVSMFAEDIAVSPDRSLAIVADGGFSSSLAFIDLATFTLRGIFELPDVLSVTIDPETPLEEQMSQADAQAVAIAADNQTVLLADYFGGSIVYGTINASRDGLEGVDRIALCPTYDPNTGCDSDNEYLGWPVNVTISPDGQTAIAAGAFRSFVWLLRITGPGQVERGTPFFVTGLPGTQSTAATLVDECEFGGTQSVAFSPDGSRAYVESNSLHTLFNNTTECAPVAAGDLPNTLSWLRITGPGAATVGGSGVADLLGTNSGQFFGVDTLAVTPDGTYALATNPTNGDAIRNVSVVNLTNFAVTEATTDTEYPIGVDTFAQLQAQVPLFTPWGAGALSLLFGLMGFARLRKKRQ